MAERQFYNKHNMVVGIDLQAQGIENYRQMLEFLVRSRIFHALTHSPSLMIEYIRQFWATARYDCQPNPPVIRARVNNNDIAFSGADLRTILVLGTEAQENGPTEFPIEMRAGAFQRMGYTGDLTKSQYTKSFLYGQWRYLMHVMIVSLAAKKAGFDTMNAKLQSGMLSLVYNKPFSFSQFFFSEFVHQITAGARERFLLYPRFVMMIIRHFLPDIPPQALVVQVSTVDRRIYADCLSHSSRRAADQRPQQTPLFGYLMNDQYVAPPNDGWLDVAQPDQPAANAEAVVPEQPQPKNVQVVPLVAEQQAVIDDVFHQVDQQQHQGADPIVPDVAEAVVRDVSQ